MRTVSAAVLVLCASAGLLQPALAQPDCTNKLGVARTIAINASRGPKFGTMYKTSLLKDGEVVLTFDDGPSRAYTRPILEALAAQCTKATFFMVGRMAIAHPALVKEVARRGHTVATHTWSHGNLQLLPPLAVEAEIELGLSAVQQALGKPAAPFFRFPYLRHTPSSLSYVRKRQLATFAIDIDSRDFEIKDATALHKRVLQELTAKRKGIILQHDIHASTARALPGLLAELKERGFRVVHVAPKAGAETLAYYDALVRQEVERRRLAASGHPPAKRSMAWPATALSGSSPPDPGTAPAPAEEDWISELWRQ